MRVPVDIRGFRRASTRRQLPFPATPNLRVAHLAPISLFDRAAAFPEERWPEFEIYRPQALVGSAAQLHTLRDQVEIGSVDVASVDHAVFVLTGWGEKPVSDISRVVFWQAFGVPIYELFVDPTGTLLASECEAQEGWHIEQHAKFTVMDGELMVDMPRQKSVPTGLFGHIETAVCACGRAGARVVPLETHILNGVRHELAATA